MSDNTQPVTIRSRPEVIEGERVMGIVPGKPAAGEEKRPADEDMVMVWPHLLVRHAVAALAVLLLVLVIAVLFDAPLKEIANPTVTPNPEKAPWYFVALQELLAHFHPLVAGVLVPGAIILGLVSLPYIDRTPFKDPIPPGGPLDVHRISGHLDNPHTHRVRLPRAQLVVGVALGRMAW